MLDAGVVLKPILGEVFAVAGVLETTVGHLGHQGDVAVNPDSSKVEALGEAHRAAVVSRPHTGGQTVENIVGHLHGFLLLGEGLHRDHGSKYFVLNSVIFLLQAGDHGGFNEVASVALSNTTGLDCGVFWQSVDHAHHAGHLVLVVDRTIEGVGVTGQTGLHVRSNPLRESGHELIVDILVDEDPGGSGAVLTGVEIPGRSNTLDSFLDVSVIKDDDGCFSTELQVNTLEVARGSFPPPCRREPSR